MGDNTQRIGTFQLFNGFLDGFKKVFSGIKAVKNGMHNNFGIGFGAEVVSTLLLGLT